MNAQPQNAQARCMQKLIVSIVVLAVLFAVALGAAQSTDDKHDGYWWERLNFSRKIFYLTGYGDGLDMGLHGGNRAEADSKKIFDMLGGGVTHGQHKESLDRFYADSRNKRIPVPDAIGYVTFEIKGTFPRAELDRILAGMRKKMAK